MQPWQYFVIVGAVLLILCIGAGLLHTRAKYPGTSVRHRVWARGGETFFGGGVVFTPREYTGFVAAWDVATGKLLWRSTAAGPIEALTLAPNDDSLVVCHRRDGASGAGVTHWSTQTGQTLWTNSMSDATDAAFSADATTLLVSVGDGIASLDRQTGWQTAFWSRDGKTTGWITHIKPLPDGATYLVQASSWGDGMGGGGEGSGLNP